MNEDRAMWYVIGTIAISVIVGGLFFKSSAPSSAPTTVGTAQSVTQATTRPEGDIAKSASDIPAPLNRGENTLVQIELTTEELVAEIMPGVTYKYWTYNRTVPGPMLRVLEGDDVEVTIYHGAKSLAHADDSFAVSMLGVGGAWNPIPVALADSGHSHGDAHTPGSSATNHDAEGHGTHSIDLHAVYGPGGGAAVTQVGHDGPKTFRFKALRPGVYVYHCASPHIPTHIANGMYGMILVEPKEGLTSVDREFYLMQGELYTSGVFGQLGHQAFDKTKMSKEEPEYYVFNGRVGALTGERAMRANVGEKIRLFVGVGTFMPSNFHIIGGVLDSLYPEGDIVSAPRKNVQTTLIPAGGAVMIEFTPEVPGTYILVDHSLTRAIDKGAVAQIVVEGEARPELYRAVER